ncbi:MAG: hypothetical protein ABTQ27_05875 [Amaricoccus sp.]|uniref:hypothetical protein n=1 Tax=Amaricoccus sp. TaxID=1872485 RepID=UPI00331647FE
MTTLILLTLTLVIAVAVIAYNLALYVMPLMVGVTAFQLAHGAGAGIVLSGITASGAVMLAVAIVLALLCLVRHPVVRLGGVAIFAGPAAIAGFALTHGVLKHAVESGIAVNVLSVVGGLAIGVAAVANVLVRAASPR